MTNVTQVVFGDQLFPHDHLAPPGHIELWMAEDRGLCTQVRHHQQKLVLFLSAMRSWRDAARERGYTVHYRQLDDPGAWDQDFWDALADHCQRTGVRQLQTWTIADTSTRDACAHWVASQGLALETLPTPGLVASTDAIDAWFSDRSHLKLHDFYCAQRKRTGILLEPNGKPRGGKWSFDSENRDPLPDTVEPPPRVVHTATPHTTAVRSLVADRFSDHPGRLDHWNWPTTRAQALAELDDFCHHRLAHFGQYQDALTNRHDTVFHSLLSPAINLGLLTPNEVITAVLEQSDRVPLASIEGFIRQIIGWREFLYGVHRHHAERQWRGNTFDHQHQLSDAWWTGTTDLPVLDQMIDKCQRLGYAHHIERLMVAGNVMLLAGIHPHAAWRWFMELFVDSSEWVMGPNVFGMALYSDGGLFATKPYICASAYWRKQGRLPKRPWCDGLDGLYWQFVERHHDLLAANPRTVRMTWGLKRLSAKRRHEIDAAADILLGRLIV